MQICITRDEMTYMQCMQPMECSQRIQCMHVAHGTVRMHAICITFRIVLTQYYFHIYIYTYIHIYIYLHMYNDVAKYFWGFGTNRITSFSARS